jgi:circadian clock protein KaiC
MTRKGLDLVDVYIDGDRILTGSARTARDAQRQVENALRRQEMDSRRKHLARKREAGEAQIASLRAGMEGEEEEFKISVEQETQRQRSLANERGEMARLRGGNGGKSDKRTQKP